MPVVLAFIVIHLLFPVMLLRLHDSIVVQILLVIRSVNDSEPKVELCIYAIFCNPNHKQTWLNGLWMKFARS